MQSIVEILEGMIELVGNDKENESEMITGMNMQE